MLYRKTLEARTRVLGEQHPDTIKTLYDLACNGAARGHRAAALDWLRQAVESGWADADSLAEDPNLEPLHGDPEFEAIAAEVKKHLGKE